MSRTWLSNRSAIPWAFALVLLLLPSVATGQGTLFVTDDNVGIGTDTPQHRLHILSQNGNAQIRMDASGETAAARTMMNFVNNGRPQLRLVNNFSSQQWAVEVGDDKDFQFRNLSGGGVVGELKANGNLVLAGDVITSSCPGGCGPADFVFEPDYELMPLSELERFIRQEKHLPNVPSAEEMGAGVKMTWMQMRLLEKIEELTLYTLDQQRELEELRATNTTLAERLAALEARVPTTR